MHPSEAFHGDFGRIGPDDMLLILSNSGETEEILKILPVLKKLDVKKIALTASDKSTLAKSCDVTIAYGRVTEACPLGLAPTTSTAIMLAVGDALALTLSDLRGFSSLDFARFHPGGSLGRKLQKVEEAMRPVNRCRVCHEGTIIRDAISDQAKENRRTGAILVNNDEGKLVGIFTDTDLVRLIERKEDHCLDLPMKDLMSPNPKSVVVGQFVSEATEVLSQFSISELPVVNDSGQAVGVLDITDLI